MIDGTKSRILWLERYLFRYTDKDHVVSTPELIRLIDEHFGYAVNRTTLPNDFALLDEQGFHCEVIRSRQNLYYHDDRLFSTPELQVLLDAVLTSPFISEEQAVMLAGKLSSLTSVYEEQKLHKDIGNRNRYPESRNKALEVVRDSIGEGCQVRIEREGKDAIIMSPFGLVWDDGQFLVAGKDSDKKMKAIPAAQIISAKQLTGTSALKKPKKLDLRPFTAARFYDADTEPAEVSLLCSKAVRDDLRERFGSKAKSSRNDDGTFQITVTLCPSQAFYSWVFQNAGEVQITGPQDVRKTFLIQCEKSGRSGDLNSKLPLLSENQIQMLDDAAKKPIRPDKDSPAYSYEKLVEMWKKTPKRKSRN